MKLLFSAINSASLKSDIIKLVESDKAKTWEIHEDSGEKYLKHTGQWSTKGVIKLTPDTAKTILNVEVLKFKGFEGAVKDFEGYYLGRFCELMFVHFAVKFTSIGKG